MRKTIVALAAFAALGGCIKVDKSPPTNLPAYVQLYPGAVTIMHLDVAGMTSVEQQASATPDDVVGFYRGEAATNGLHETSAPATPGASADQRQAAFADAATGRMLVVVAKAQGAQTLITLTYKAAPQAPS